MKRSLIVRGVAQGLADHATMLTMHSGSPACSRGRLSAQHSARRQASSPAFVCRQRRHAMHGCPRALASARTLAPGAHGDGQALTPHNHLHRKEVMVLWKMRCERQWWRV